ncbi:MAG: nuclear transport factor 2 family protein [Promethearchaeota archaeon]
MAKDIEQVRKFAEEYIKAITKGDVKFIEKNFDFKEAYDYDKEFYGEWSQANKKSVEDYEKEGKSGLRWAVKKWDKKFSIRAIQISKDKAAVIIDAEGANYISTALILSKKTGKWKILLMPMWNFG